MLPIQIQHHRTLSYLPIFHILSPYLTLRTQVSTTWTHSLICCLLWFTWQSFRIITLVPTVTVNPLRIQISFQLFLLLRYIPLREHRVLRWSHLANSFSCVIVLSIHSIDSFICFCLFQFLMVLSNFFFVCFCFWQHFKACGFLVHGPRIKPSPVSESAKS